MNPEIKTIRNASLAGGLCVTLAVLVFLIAPSSALVKVVSDGFPLVLSFSGAVLSFSIYRRQAKSLRGRQIWGTMAMGLAFWTVGEAIWTFYELVLQQEVPYPSVADVAWAVGYIPLILSIGFQFTSLRASISRWGKRLIASIILAMIVFTVWLVVYPILVSPEAGTPFEMFFSVADPLEDLVLFAVGTALVLTFLGGQLAVSWGAIALGILLLSVSDLLFSYGTWSGLYYPEGRLNFLSGLFDILYISAYTVWTIGLFLRLRLPESGKDVDVHAFVADAEPSTAQDPEAVPFDRIVQRAHELERVQRTSGKEDLLRVYFNALIGLLHMLAIRAGGVSVGAAFESALNEKARRLGCKLELKDGHILWNEPATEPENYEALLEDAIGYAKSVVATSTIDRKLQEIEKYMAPSVIQAAEENRLRMVRWLDEKPH
jgi:hypothetical protein